MEKIFRLWYQNYKSRNFYFDEDWELKDEAILEDSKKNRYNFADKYLDCSDERLKKFINKKRNKTDVLEDVEDFVNSISYSYYIEVITVKKEMKKISDEIEKLNKKLKKLQKIEVENNEKNF